MEELFMYIDVRAGMIERFFVRDLSFVNWQALHLMVPVLSWRGLLSRHSL